MKTTFATFAFLLMTACFVAAQSPADTLNKLDAAGAKHGYWKKYNGDTLKYEGRFEHGVPTGEFTYYYTDKTVKSKTVYSNNGKTANTIMYFPSGTKLCEGLYQEQKREGLWKNYDGYDNVIARVDYKNGMKNGKSITYYQKGDVLEVANYVDNIREGDYIQYFEDSITKIKGTYVNGQRNGIFAFYHPNGLVYNSGRYVKGLREGDWMLSDETGKPIVKETFKSGNIIAREVYQKEKDPEFIKQKESDENLKNKGTTSPDNGIEDSRYDGY